MGGLPAGSPTIPGGGAHTEEVSSRAKHTHTAPSGTPVPVFSSSPLHPNTQTGPTSQAGAGIQLLNLLQSN